MRLLPVLRAVRLGIRTYSKMPCCSAVIVLADGAEEMEATISIDVLRRGEVDVTIAGLLGTEPVKCARGTVIVPEVALADVLSKKYDVVILPGGQPGTNNLASSERVGQLLKSQNEAKKLIACICAAPFVLKANGIQAGCVTAHQSVKDKMIEGGYKWSDDSVVVSDNIVTSQGPGTAFEFALKLVEILCGKEKADSLKKPLCLKM